MRNERFSKLLRFDRFELDLRTGELRSDGRKVQLQEQPFRILQLLTEHPGELITREEIRRRLWPNGTIVEFENAVNAAIKKLRFALSDSAEQPRYIETVKRRGYRLIVPVDSSDTSTSGKIGSATDGNHSGFSPSVHKLTGQIVSHYQVLERIGAGGMGVVYRAEDMRLGRQVALKFLPDELSSHPIALERLRLEARSASALSHPNICTIYEIGEHAGQPFIAMELLEGSTLRDRISGASLPESDLLEYACQIAEGLDAAHRKGIIHRDVKPANIFVTHDGRAKILDFGLAKATTSADELDRGGAGGSKHLTRPGAAAGTVAYMSPEQVLGKELDARSDLFSFGVVLYEMVTGGTPFKGLADPAIFDAILRETPPAPNRINSHLPARLDSVIAKCLEKDRDLRYRSASDLRADLQEIKRQTDSDQLEASLTPHVGTALTGRVKRIVPVALAAAIAVAVAYVYFRPPPKLTDKDTIVLADFTNSTGDPVFDGTLRRGLAIQLGQSPFLSLVSDERIEKTLRLMGQPPNARLTPEFAREVCERSGAAAVLQGSIARLGSEYVLAVAAKNCRTGDVLHEEQKQARRKEDVLGSLSQIASRFRAELGESLVTIKRHSTPLSEATTPSLEALKAFSTGWQVLVSNGHAAALSSFKRATEIDPGFASAYAWLGRTYSAIGESGLALESTRKAWELRDRASDQEKFYIDFSYDRLVTGDLEKAIETCELWAQTYPRDMRPYAFLGSTAKALGQFEKTAEGNKKAIDLDPDHPFAYVNLALSYVFRDRLAEAREVLRRASERKLEVPDFVGLQYHLAFFKNDTAEMERLAALAGNMSELRDWIYSQQASVLAYSGHLRQARGMSRHAVDLALEAGRPESAAQHEAGVAVREALFGNLNEARRVAASPGPISSGRDAEYGAALALAFSGDIERSQRLATDLETRFPKDTVVRFSYSPTLRALIALNHRNPSEAIERLNTAAPYELGWQGCCSVGFIGSLYPVYVRGLAYLAAHKGAEAAVEFQKVLDHPGIVATDPMGAVARLQLGRAFSLAGDMARARAAYQGFLTLWRDADPDVPLVKQARAEYAKLG